MREWCINCLFWILCKGVETMRLIVFIRALMVVNLVFLGCSIHEPSSKNQETNALAEPVASVKALIETYQLSVVDYAYVKDAVGMGTRESAKAIFIDACPHAKYLAGTIPSSINIPDTQIEAYIGQLSTVDKDKELIVFCGGVDCEKSAVVARYLKEKGYSTIRVYLAGEAEWRRKNYIEVGLPIVQNSVENNGVLLIDARPYVLYKAGTIPGALSIPDTEVETLKGRLPQDKTTEIVTFCAGYSCVKSHNLAKKLQAFGYHNVSVFSGGYPEWEAAGLQTIAHGSKTIETVPLAQKDAYVDGVKLGTDRGTVDGEWFKTHILNDTVPRNVVLVDVRSFEEYTQGHIQNAINIDAAKFDALTLAQKLPKDKVVIFTCQVGNRSLEAFYKLKKAEVDVSKVVYFNAGFTCNHQNQCAIKLNKPLGIH